ncbi:MAG: hypothetical protein HXY26_06015 [Hydrogenophilaceae bacterium]|nr:hypothetical protein [Hydrogenophilaceae bacterium]
MDHFLRKRQVRESLAGYDFFHLASAPSDESNVLFKTKRPAGRTCFTQVRVHQPYTGNSPAHAEIT